MDLEKRYEENPSGESLYPSYAVTMFKNGLSEKKTRKLDMEITQYALSSLKEGATRSYQTPFTE